MGATQSVATIRVFCIRNTDHNIHYWNYPGMPAGWQWQSAGISDYELMNPTEEELATRKTSWSPKPLIGLQGTLKKYNQLVATASEGCVTDNF